MSTSLRLDLRQSQQLVMTPQLQQAIKLLQMSHLELDAFVAGQIEQNPLLTREEEAERAPAEGETPRGEAAEAPPEPDTADRVTREGDPALAEETFDTGAENLHDTARADAPPPGSAPGVGPSGEEDLPDFESRLAGRLTLADHLSAQIGQMRAPAPLPGIARALVGELDPDGYLRTPLGDVAARIGATVEQALDALALVQACEPTGVGARSLAECFALQLAEAGGPDPEMQRLLDHLDLLAEGDPARLCRRARLDAEILPELLGELRRLDPRPARGWDAGTVETVVPDILMQPAELGGWRVELNPETQPRVLIDQTYAAEIRDGSAETRTFLKRCREDATWLTRSLDQRARTILKVASEIVRRQEGFFREGVSGLRPLSLAMVAEAVSLHESTVSRVTANKYMSTPRGVLELKFFFTNAVGGGDGLSSESVRERIRRLIEGETPSAVLSDDRIVQLLQADGVDIARRTVAKYRKALGIGSSSERRRQKALHAGR